MYDRNFFIGEEIVAAFLHGESRFGLTVDINRLERLVRATLSIERELEALSYATQWELEMLQDEFSMESLINGNWKAGTLQDFIENLKKFQKNLEVLRGDHSTRELASAKRNWRAVAVAEACLSIWREDQWHLAHKDMDLIEHLEGLESDETLLDEFEKFEPLSQRYHDPGPFGRFLEDIFLALNIMGKDGHPVRAANALASLRQLRGQEKKEN